jgi:galactokinase
VSEESALLEAGLSQPEAARKAALFKKVAAAHETLAGRTAPEARRYFVPGRIEVLGKHTDYAGGRSLLCAVERGFCLIASPRRDRRVVVKDTGRGLQVEVALEADLAPEAGNWEVYVATVARRIAHNFSGTLSGADIAFASDLPRASGLSSSSALVVALFSALADINRLEERPEYRASIETKEDLSGYLGCLENGQTFRDLPGDRGVGTFGGSEDHTAILCSRSGEIAQFVFCPVRHERSFALPDGLTFVVASSGVAADKAGSARDQYNRLSLATVAILDLWRRETGRADATLFSAARSSPDAAAAIWRILGKSEDPAFERAFLLGRFNQFFDETMQIIPAVAGTLARGDLAAVGPLVDRSQKLAEHFLGNQVPETIELAREARRLGAVAASAFGAGFGGSVWALVGARDAEAFRARWSESYARRFPEAASKAEFFPTRPGPALVRV